MSDLFNRLHPCMLCAARTSYDCLLESIQHKATDQANPFVFTDKQEVNDIYKANRQAAKLSVDWQTKSVNPYLAKLSIQISPPAKLLVGARTSGGGADERRQQRRCGQAAARTSDGSGGSFFPSPWSGWHRSRRERELFLSCEHHRTQNGSLVWVICWRPIFSLNSLCLTHIWVWISW